MKSNSTLTLVLHVLGCRTVSEDIKNEVGKIFISISGEFLNRMRRNRVCCGVGKVSFPFECFVFAVTYVTEISLIVTLNNQFTSPRIYCALED